MPFKPTAKMRFVVAAVLLVASAPAASAFSLTHGLASRSTLQTQLPRSSRYASRNAITNLQLSAQSKDKGKFFFLARNPIDRDNERGDGLTMFTRVPQDTEVSCACGSKRSYGNCCKKFHDSGEAPDDPVNLIRARYSAFAYRLPGYIMRTTAQGSPDWKINQNQWEKEILGFCDGYRYMKLDGDPLGVMIEQCNLTGPDTAFVQFRVVMMGRDFGNVEFLERSKLVRKRGRWLYYTGHLLEYVGKLV